jgi:hypothetical protein
MQSVTRKEMKAFSLLWAAALAVALLACQALPVGRALAEVQPRFLYKLSDFDGPVAFKTAQIQVDNWRNEIYVADTRQAEVRIFNAQGMEVYRFGDDGSLGSLIDIAVSKAGDLFILGRRNHKPVMIQCDFKGRPLNRLNLTGLPPQFAACLPNRLIYRHEQLFLMDTMNLLLVVTDSAGRFVKGYDIARLIGISTKQRGNTEIGGFNVDPHGNIFFTVPVMFSAYRLTPEGEIAGFGTPGSAPGRFGVVGGIAADAQGYCYVADRLKSVILVFDRNFKFQTEFGYRGGRPHNLISPGDIELDAAGRLYVSQLGNRGVSVFKITHP